MVIPWDPSDFFLKSCIFKGKVSLIIVLGEEYYYRLIPSMPSTRPPYLEEKVDFLQKTSSPIQLKIQKS
jgi:hypothetical protein